MATMNRDKIGQPNPERKAKSPLRFGSFSIIALAFVMTNSWCSYTGMS